MGIIVVSAWLVVMVDVVVVVSGAFVVSALVFVV